MFCTFSCIYANNSLTWNLSPTLCNFLFFQLWFAIVPNETIYWCILLTYFLLDFFTVLYCGLQLWFSCFLMFMVSHWFILHRYQLKLCELYLLSWSAEFNYLKHFVFLLLSGWQFLFWISITPLIVSKFFGANYQIVSTFRFANPTHTSLHAGTCAYVSYMQVPSCSSRWPHYIRYPAWRKD